MAACWARARVSRDQGGRETWTPASSEHRRAVRRPRRTLERSLAGTSGTRSERTRAATTTSEDLRCAARRRPLAGGGLGRCLSRQAVHEATCARVQRAGEDSTSRRERGEKGQDLGLGGEFEASDGRAQRKPTRLPMKRRDTLKSPEPRPRHRAPGGRYLQSWRDSRKPKVTAPKDFQEQGEGVADPNAKTVLAAPSPTTWFQTSASTRRRSPPTALNSALRPGCCTRVPATIMRWDRRPKRCEALGEPKTLRRSLPAAGHAACAWTEQSGLAEGEKWRLKRPLRAAVQDAKRTHAGGVYFSLAPTLGYYELNVVINCHNF